jgi:hypothetical protein
MAQIREAARRFYEYSEIQIHFSASRKDRITILSCFIHWNISITLCSLTVNYGDKSIREINPLPSKTMNFTFSHSSIQGHPEGRH